MNETVIDRFATYRLVSRYYVAFIIIFGMIGNGTCLILYRRASLKRCRRVQYLTALALSDLVFLLCLGLMWLKGVGVHWQEMPGVCSASIYISNTASFLSGWYVMVLTAEMACVLRRPYHIVRTTAGSRLNVAKRIAGVSVIGMMLNSWTLFVTQSNKQLIAQPNDIEYAAEYEDYYDNETNASYSTESIYDAPQSRSAIGSMIQQSDYKCQIALNSTLLYNTFTVIDMIASFSIPLVVTLVLNLYIGCTITRAARQRRYMSHHQILVRLRAKAQAGAETRVTSPGSIGMVAKSNSKGSVIAANHQPLSKNDSANSGGSAGDRKSALKHRESGGTVLSEVASRLRRLAVRQRLRAEATVSSLLVAKSLTYLLLNFPNYAHRIWLALRSQEMPSDQNSGDQNLVSETEFLLQMIVYLTFYTQYALNFVIYSSQAFVRNVCNSERPSHPSSVVK